VQNCTWDGREKAQEAQEPDVRLKTESVFDSPVGCRFFSEPKRQYFHVFASFVPLCGALNGEI
jgi:hypothetical protein